MPLAWTLLLAAIGLEVVATAALPRTDSFRDPAWSALVVGGYAASIYLLSVVVRDIPVSITYALWSGLGTAGIVVVGVLVLGESLDWVKVGAIGAILAGVLVLNLHGSH